MRKLTIGFAIAPQHGDMDRMRKTWMAAEELGVERIWTADHFHAQSMNADDYSCGQAVSVSYGGKNFEATMVLAAMAATTSRVEIGCSVHAVGYRNPNLLADIARTTDHICGGRYILGLGAGYLRPDYDEYGYPFGTQKTRLLDLANAVPVIKARLEKLNPKPLRKIPILIASMGEKIGMPIVARHADLWHVFGPPDKIREKCAALKRICGELGRNPDEIEITANCMPQIMPDDDPDTLIGLGATHLIGFATGPDWDLGPLKELLTWRRALQR
jgi:probable F420-dependent oxidoreductase